MRIIIDQDHEDQRIGELDDFHSIERFWGDSQDPMSLLLACEDVDCVIINIAAIGVKKSDITFGEKSPPPLSKPFYWEGAQRRVGALFKRRSKTDREGELLSRNLSTDETSEPHHATDEKSDSDVFFEDFPLFKTFTLSPIDLPSSLHFIPNPLGEKALIFICPSILAGSEARLPLGDRAFASYQLAGWSPNLICYDWIVDHLGQRYLDRSQSLIAKINSSTYKEKAGDLSGAILSLFYSLCDLKLSREEVFNGFLEGQLSLSHLDQKLSFIGVNDLVTATLILAQTHSSGNRYLLDGGTLTWRSLTQICAHLIDGLSPVLTQEIRFRLKALLYVSHESHSSSPLKRLTRALRRQANSDRGALFALNLTITDLIARSDGGAEMNRDTRRFTSLTHRFEPSSVSTILERELRSLITRLSTT